MDIVDEGYHAMNKMMRSFGYYCSVDKTDIPQSAYEAVLIGLLLEYRKYLDLRAHVRVESRIAGKRVEYQANPWNPWNEAEPLVLPGPDGRVYDAHTGMTLSWSLAEKIWVREDKLKKEQAVIEEEKVEEEKVEEEKKDGMEEEEDEDAVVKDEFIARILVDWEKEMVKKANEKRRKEIMEAL
jgi:hypothetical protein